MDKEILVQNIKKFCELKGVKPTVACRESGAGKDLINRLETGGSIPSVEKVQMLADYLGVTTSELLGEEPKGETIPHQQYREVLQEGGIRLLLDADAKLTKEQLDDIVEFIKFKQRKNGR